MLAPLGIVPAHFGLLTTLATLGPVPQAEVGRRLGISGASVVQMVDHLEARGLLERRRLEWDRRTQVLHLRPGATEALARAKALAEETLATRLGSLGVPDIKRLVHLLQRFVIGDEESATRRPVGVTARAAPSATAG